MNNFISNVSLADIVRGTHEDAGRNSMLIQIVDMVQDYPTPFKDFRNTYRFKFDDETEGPNIITDEQVEHIKTALLYARDYQMNVIVHCVAGLCRSGAVVEVGIKLGFNPPDRLRQPNPLVLSKLCKAFGFPETPVAEMPKHNGIVVPPSYLQENF